MKNALLPSLAVGAALFAVAQAPASVRAQTRVIDPIDVPPENDPLAHAWDEPDERGGFYLRAGFGLGFQSTRVGQPPWESDSYGEYARGFVTDFGLDLGWALNDHVALSADSHASVLWSGHRDRDFGIDDLDYGRARIAALGFAPAVTLFTRRDFFFKVGLGVGFARSRWPDHKDTTKPGLFTDLMVGKEVYRDDHSAVGFHMQFVYMRLGDEDRDQELRVRALTWGVNYAFDSL